MTPFYLAFAGAAILLVIVYRVRPKSSYLKGRKSIPLRVLVYGFIIMISLLALGARSTVYTPVLEKPANAPTPVMVPVSEDERAFHAVLLDFQYQGIMLNDFDPSAAGIEQKAGIRQMNGSNNDCTMTLSVYQNSQTGTIKAYRLYTVGLTTPAMKALMKDVLPAWIEGADWLDESLEKENQVSTTFKDALIDLSTNELSDEPAYLLQIYPHGYENL